MSTHIGPAFRLKPDTDVFTFAEKLRETTHPALKQFLFQHMYSMAVTTYDCAGTFKPFKDIIKDEMDEHCYCTTKDRSWVTQTVADTAANIYRDSNNNLYLLIQGAPQEVAEAVETMDEVEGDFSYHNSSDSQLEHMTEEEWEGRSEKWNSLLKDNGYAPTYSSGINIHLGLEPHLLKMEDFEAVEPSLTPESAERRKATIIKNVYIRLLLGTAENEQEKSDLFGKVISTMGSPKFLPLDEEHPELVEAATREGEKIWQERRNLA